MERREELQIVIEEQQETDFEGLEEEDKYLTKINLDESRKTSGEHQDYWLLSVKVARDAFLIRAARRSGLRQHNHG